MRQVTGTTFRLTLLGSLALLVACSQQPAAEDSASTTTAATAPATQPTEAGIKPAPRLANGMVNLGLAAGERGFWGSSDSTAQVAFRASNAPSHRSFFSSIGFRLARTIT